MSDAVQFAGLEDLEGMTGDVSVCKITLPNGKVKRFRLGHLGYSEYNEIVVSLPGPVVPTRVNMGKREPDTDDPVYKMKQMATEERRRALLLAASLEKGGLVIPGDTLALKADWVGKRPTNIIGALLQGFMLAHHGLTGRLEQLADTFQPVSDDGAAAAAAVEPD